MMDGRVQAKPRDNCLIGAVPTDLRRMEDELRSRADGLEGALPQIGPTLTSLVFSCCRRFGQTCAVSDGGEPSVRTKHAPTLAVLMACHNRREGTVACSRGSIRETVIRTVQLHVYLVDDGVPMDEAAIKLLYPEVVYSVERTFFLE